MPGGSPISFSEAYAIAFRESEERASTEDYSYPASRENVPVCCSIQTSSSEVGPKAMTSVTPRARNRPTQDPRSAAATRSR